MGKLEALVIVLNSIIIFSSYFLLYPKVAGNSFNKIAFFDLLSSGAALGLVGAKFWGTEQVFHLLSIELNWFWFTIISYGAVEIPVSFWYFKKYNVDTNFK